jgi:hypothetical protein
MEWISMRDRLGLFKNLAVHGPATSEELAERAGIRERYAREWLGGMTSAFFRGETPSDREPVQLVYEIRP